MSIKHLKTLLLAKNMNSLKPVSRSDVFLRRSSWLVEAIFVCRRFARSINDRGVTSPRFRKKNQHDGFCTAEVCAYIVHWFVIAKTSAILLWRLFWRRLVGCTHWQSKDNERTTPVSEEPIRTWGWIRRESASAALLRVRTFLYCILFIQDYHRLGLQASFTNT